MTKRKGGFKRKGWGKKKNSTKGPRGWHNTKASKSMRKSYHFTKGGVLKRGAGLNI